MALHSIDSKMDGTSIRMIDPAADARWDAFVDRAPGSSVFQHSSWKTVIERTFQLRPFYFTLEDDAQNILGGIPFFFKRSPITGKALISLPFADYSDVLTDGPEHFSMLWRGVMETGNEKGARYIEIRSRDKGGIELERYAFERGSTYLNHFLEVGKDLEFIEKKVIDRSYKCDIRQAVKNGVVVRSATGEPDMKEYYRLYVMTRAHHGLPPIPYVFFKNVWDILSPPKMVYLFLAYRAERLIGGIIFLRHKKCLYALSNSSDRRFLDKKPNHLLWWRGIQLAVDLGLTGLDFGRTAPDNEGLRFFKRRWGTREREIHHYRCGMGHATGNGHGLGRIEKALAPALKVLPPWALKAIGKVAYRCL